MSTPRGARTRQALLEDAQPSADALQIALDSNASALEGVEEKTAEDIQKYEDSAKDCRIFAGVEVLHDMNCCGVLGSTT